MPSRVLETPSTPDLSAPSAETISWSHLQEQTWSLFGKLILLLELSYDQQCHEACSFMASFDFPDHACCCRDWHLCDRFKKEKHVPPLQSVYAGTPWLHEFACNHLWHVDDLHQEDATAVSFWHISFPSFKCVMCGSWIRLVEESMVSFFLQCALWLVLSVASVSLDFVVRWHCHVNSQQSTAYHFQCQLADLGCPGLLWGSAWSVSLFICVDSFSSFRSSLFFWNADKNRNVCLSQ